METFKSSLATLTGGSGAVAVLLTDGSFSGREAAAAARRRARRRPRSSTRSAAGGSRPSARLGPAQFHQFMATDSAAVLKHGVELGARTWEAFLRKLGWVARTDRQGHLPPGRLGAPRDDPQDARDRRGEGVLHLPYLGNIGTVSLPLTAALAEDRDFLRPGDRVGLPRHRQRPELPDARPRMVEIGSGIRMKRHRLSRAYEEFVQEHPGRDLDRGGLRYHYLDEGEGEPVVMVHGNPTWSFYYRELVEALRADRTGRSCPTTSAAGCRTSRATIAVRLHAGEPGRRPRGAARPPRARRRAHAGRARLGRGDRHGLRRAASRADRAAGRPQHGGVPLARRRRRSPGRSGSAATRRWGPGWCAA